MTGPVQAAHELTFQAQAARAEGAPAADCVPLWESAAIAWEALGEPYPRARALFRLAEADLAGGARSRRGLLGAAAGRRPGPRARRRPAAGRHHCAGPPGPDPAGRPAPSPPAAAATPAAAADGDPRLGLTQREFEVLRLVAAGMSNGAIAAELFISAKTVSVHVSNILGKLGTASRGEAAALAHRLRLFDGSPTA